MRHFLIGTLRTIENEFDQCIKSLSIQSEITFEHFVIKNQPDKLAHEQLYHRFVENRDSFRYFIKLDADVVLTGNLILNNIFNRIKDDSEHDVWVFGLFDFFIGGRIYGLHIYRSSIIWPSSQDPVFTDAFSVPSERIAYDKTSFGPCGCHCPDPSPLQCFRWGMHRALKLRVARARSDLRRCKSHLGNLGKLAKMARQDPDPRRLLAVTAALETLEGAWDESAFDADNQFIVRRAQLLSSRAPPPERHAEILESVLEEWEHRIL